MNEVLCSGSDVASGEGRRADSQEVLPEHWPSQPTFKSAQPWWIPWPLAVLLAPLLWIMPRRLGPHFAAVPWTGAVVAHMLWMPYGLGCVLIGLLEPHFGWAAWLFGQTPGERQALFWPAPTFMDMLAAPAAFLMALFAGHPQAGIPGMASDWRILTVAAHALLVWEILLLLISASLAAHITVNEPCRILFSRSYKMVLWVSTSLAVCGLALQVVALLPVDHFVHSQFKVLFICLYVIWALRLCVRAGSRYPGSIEELGRPPLQPRCEKCGYGLTGFRRTDTCPECGRPVAESMPDRRVPSPFAAARGLRRIPAFFVTCGRVWFDKRFFETLAFDASYSSGRSFAVCVSLLAGLPAVIGLTLASSPNEIWGSWSTSTGPLPNTVGLAVLWAFSTLLALLCSSSPQEPWVKDWNPRRHATVFFYWSPWLLPLAFVMGLAGGVFIRLRKAIRSDEVVSLGPLPDVELGFLLSATVFVVPLGLLTLGFARLKSRTQMAEYANA